MDILYGETMKPKPLLNIWDNKKKHYYFEPLKDKLVKPLYDEGGFFLPKDVASAVDYLKEYLQNVKKCYGKETNLFENDFIFYKIDEAFSDVISRKGCGDLNTSILKPSRDSTSPPLEKKKYKSCPVPIGKYCNKHGVVHRT